MVWGRNDFLSLFVKQESDNSLSLKLLLCLEMALCSEWFGLSLMDRSQFIVTEVWLSSTAPTTEPAFLTSADAEGRQTSEEVQTALSFPARSLCVGSPVHLIIQLNTQVFVHVVLVVLRSRWLESHHVTKSLISSLYSSCPLLVQPTIARRLQT